MCGYCGCQSIELIGRLTTQHEEIINATTSLRTAARDHDARGASRACVVIAELLDPHTRLEERGLFAELRLDATFTAHIDALCAEHRAIDSELEAIGRGDLDRVAPLIRLLRDHIGKEEDGLFPAALAALDGEQWERLHSDDDSERIRAAAGPRGR